MLPAGNDGTATLEQQTKLLPAGRIRFEFGTNQDIRAKANMDYEARKRSAAIDETFVSATPRRWQAQDAWVAERQTCLVGASRLARLSGQAGRRHAR